jgi:hypothetical protein
MRFPHFALDLHQAEFPLLEFRPKRPCASIIVRAIEDQFVCSELYFSFESDCNAANCGRYFGPNLSAGQLQYYAGLVVLKGYTARAGRDCRACTKDAVAPVQIRCAGHVQGVALKVCRRNSNGEANTHAGNSEWVGAAHKHEHAAAASSAHDETPFRKHDANRTGIGVGWKHQSGRKHSDQYSSKKSNTIAIHGFFLSN